MSATGSYLAKIERFVRLFDDRVAAALSFVADDPQAVHEIKRAQEIIKDAVQELVGSYKIQYVDDGALVTKDDVVGLIRLEANIAMATQQTLSGMQELIRMQSRSANWTKPLRTRACLHSIRKITSSLERREDNAPLSIPVAVKEMLCAGRKPFKTALSVIGLVGLYRPVSDWPRVLDASNFVRSDDITFEGVTDALERTAAFPRRALVVIGNHDTTIYDGAVAFRAAHLLGTEHHILMARKSVYPIPPPESAGDVVYVDEDDPTSYPIAESVAKIKDSLARNNVVSIAIYPEGMLPFAGAQMPLITKDGAFLVARKLAIALSEQDIPVFVIELKSNTLSHLTQIDYVPATVKVAQVSQVPSQPMVRGQRDPWIDHHRIATENRFNVDRGVNMIDIVSATRVPDSLTFEARGLSDEW